MIKTVLSLSLLLNFWRQKPNVPSSSFYTRIFTASLREVFYSVLCWVRKSLEITFVQYPYFLILNIPWKISGYRCIEFNSVYIYIYILNSPMAWGWNWSIVSCAFCQGDKWVLFIWSTPTVHVNRSRSTRNSQENVGGLYRLGCA